MHWFRFCNSFVFLMFENRKQGTGEDSIGLDYEDQLGVRGSSRVS